MTDSNNNTPPVQKSKKGTPVNMIAVSILLAATLIFLVIMYFDQKNKMVENK